MKFDKYYHYYIFFWITHFNKQKWLLDIIGDIYLCIYVFICIYLLGHYGWTNTFFVKFLHSYVDVKKK